MASDSLFLQLAIVLGLSAIIGFFVYRFKLPLLVAYLLAGVVLSFLQLFDVSRSLALTSLPELGIALVLFFIGMELDIKEIKHLGKPIVIGSLIQILISVLVGFEIATLLGFAPATSWLLGMGLAFSSTIVVIKLLLEKGDLSSLYGKLSVGISLVEDLVAVLILMVMSVSSSVLDVGLQSNLPILGLLIKGTLLLLLSLVLSRYVLEKMFKAVANSGELLFLVALAWCFIFIMVATLMGFSVVIGAFLAGVALANSSFHFEIQGKVKPLRDFFVTLFFVYLGSQVKFDHLVSVLPLILVFTGYALIIKPVIFLLILGIFGFKKHTMFQTSLSLGQISEFSLIILVVGEKTGLVPADALTAMAVTGVLSIIVSSVMISYSKSIYKKLSPFVAFFERNFAHPDESEFSGELPKDHVVLIGAHRIGSEVIGFLQQEKVPLIVVDFNPKIITELTKKGFHAIYGDVGDPEFLEFLNLKDAKLVISTATNIDDNLTLLSELKRTHSQAVIVSRAASPVEAETLYKSGASYVVLPETISGDFLATILKSHWPGLSYFKDRAHIELGKINKSTLDRAS